MRILTCLWRSYYDDPVAENPNYVYFVELLRRMGHEVCFFDHVAQARWSKEAMNDAFLSLVRGGRFDVIFVETFKDEFFTEVLDQASELTVTVAFNSDDDVRWLDYSSKLYPHFRYSVTTYPHIHEHFRRTNPNLLLSPWACGHLYDGSSTVKDIQTSFVGGLGASRRETAIRLRGAIGLEVYGRGAGKLGATASQLSRIVGNRLSGRPGTKEAARRWVAGRLGIETSGLSYEAVNDVWNRTRVSWTPLDLGDEPYATKLRMAEAVGQAVGGASSPWTSRCQVKGRVFELGSTRTLMLCDRDHQLDEYYTRGVEYEDFGCEAELVEKARYYLSHEEARAKIAAAYYDRTMTEHLWQHRFEDIFRSIRGD